MPEGQIVDGERPHEGAQIAPAIRGRLDRVLGRDLQARLHTNRFEVARRALGEVRELCHWRQAATASPFAPFYDLFEGATAIAGAPISDGEKQALQRELIDQLSSKAQSLTPRVADLYQALLAELEGTIYAPHFDEMTAIQLASLRDSGDLALLVDPTVPFTIKQNRMDNRVIGELRGRRALDKRDSQQEAKTATEKPRPTASGPSPNVNESKPSMDEMNRLKEGEVAPAIWTISPAYGGYFREQSFDTWDPSTNTWRQSTYDYQEVRQQSEDMSGEHHTLVAQVSRDRWVRVPASQKFVFSKIVSGGYIQIKQDQNGDYLILSDQDATIALDFVPSVESRVAALPPSTVISPPVTLSPDTTLRLEEIAQTKKTNLQKARALARYTRQRLTYSNDSSYNAIYDAHSDGYVAAIDEHRKADCDVANTYFAGLCAALKIPVRHVVGHMVRGKDGAGKSYITSGTGHAWSEVWDDNGKKWIRIDATPPGDPLNQEENKQGEEAPGDYGEQEAVGPTPEELAELEAKLSQLTERLSYTSEERDLAEAAGIEPAEAREIVREIHEAENIRLPNGERITDVLAQFFSLLQQTRTTYRSDYMGPVRRREGGEEIENIVAHRIALESGQTDPASRQKPYEASHEEQVLHQMRVRIIGDKSGSMANTVEDESKLKIQRRMAYLLVSALHMADQNFRRATTRMREPLSVQSQVISFRGGEAIDEDKLLSPDFTAADKVKMWKSLGNQGGGNGDTAALTYIKDQLINEREELALTGGTQDWFDFIIACSDGMPDDPAVVKELIGEVGAMGAVTLGLGITETAAQVPIIFDTPHSTGVVAKDMNDMPAIAARHLVLAAVQLFPEASLPGVQKFLTATLAKFERAT